MTTEFKHIPVLLAEVMHYLSPQPGSIVVDCTLGGGGHSSAFADLITPGGTLVGIDQDDVALDAAANTLRLGQHKDTEIILLRGNFGQLDSLLVDAGIPYADVIFFDIGVSSPQIDDLDRGFTFKSDAPLDMRMDQSAHSLTASDVVMTYSESELTRIIREYGEEKWASRIAKFIVNERQHTPITTSAQLVELIKAAIPASARRAGGHPAKRTFQALRIEVNHELEMLEKGLEAAIRWLSPGGRVGVLTFHSLEDRIVKQTFARYAQSCECPPDIPMCVCSRTPVLKVVTRKAVVPSAEEIEENSRSRSTKLRVAQKL